MKENTCCFTGHRNLPAGKIDEIKQQLGQTVEKLAQAGIINFCAGGALGFDTLAAKAVLELRKRRPQVNLILVLPCKGQTRGWPERDVQTYEDIISMAQEVLVLSENYYNGCMQQRNRRMVDMSSVCVNYCNESRSGSASTVEYAQKKGLRMISFGEYMPQTSLFDR